MAVSCVAVPLTHINRISLRVVASYANCTVAKLIRLKYFHSQNVLIVHTIAGTAPDLATNLNASPIYATARTVMDNCIACTRKRND